MRRFPDLISSATLVLALLLSIGAQAQPVAPASPAEISADVVVVGGGPAGLAAAIEARLHGAKQVVVLEKRGPERSRMQVLNLRRGTLNNLARLGVSLKDGENMTILKREEVASDLTGKHSNIPLKAPVIDGARAGYGVSDLAHGTGAALMPIRSLENELTLAAQRMGGIDVQFQAEVADVIHQPNGVVAVVKDPAGIERRVRGEFMVVSDGAHSAVSEKLGVQKLNVSDKTDRIVLGVFDQNGGARLKYHEIPGQSMESSGIIGLGATHAGVLAQIPPELSFATPDARKSWYLGQAEKVGYSGALLLEPTEINISLNRADRLAIDNRVFIIGDAARTTHVFTGTGVNFALRDSARFGALYDKLKKAHTETEREKAVSWFVRKTEQSTDLNHRLAMVEFPVAKSATKAAPKPTTLRPAVRAALMH